MATNSVVSFNKQTDLATGLDAVITVNKALGDRLRAHVVRTLAQDAFSVSELCTIFAVTQPAISHHLRILRDAHLVESRKEGTSIFYQRPVHPTASWVQAIFSALDVHPMAGEYAAGVAAVYSQRQRQSVEFFINHSDILQRQQDLVCPSPVYSEPVMACAMQAAGAQARALEVGPGDGFLLNALSPHYGYIDGIDSNRAMLDQARMGLAQDANVALLHKDFFELQAPARYHLIVAAMVLHHLPSPRAFFEQAARLLEPNGRIVVAELCEHDQEWTRTQCGDLWLGIAPETLNSWARQFDLQPDQHHFLARRNGFRIQVASFRRADSTESFTSEFATTKTKEPL